MNTRAELEAALARAEADWRRARDDMDKARAALASANTGWDKVVSDRRQAPVERRKANTNWEATFTDRRKSLSDRRIPVADINALSKAVTDQHKAYLERSQAEADLTDAASNLKAASDARDKTIAALNQLKRV